MRIHVTYKGSGKMEGKVSINDSPYDNPYCVEECPQRHICYAKRMTLIRPSVRRAFKQNGDIMSMVILDEQTLPSFEPGLSVRIHSYGEFRNMSHLINIMNICRKNPKTRFVVWTHRKDLIHRYMKDTPLPDNARFIYSSDVNDVNADIPAGFHGVYIPVSDVVAEEEDISLICVGQKCKDCGRCYHTDNIGRIYAKLKPFTVPAEYPIRIERDKVEGATV